MEVTVSPADAKYIEGLRRTAEVEAGARREAEARAARAERERDQARAGEAAAQRQVRTLTDRADELALERRQLVVERDSSRSRARKAESDRDALKTRVSVLEGELRSVLARLARGDASRRGAVTPILDIGAGDEEDPAAVLSAGTRRRKGVPTVPANTPEPERKPRKPRAPEHNRARRREEPTRSETHVPQECGHCHGRLGKPVLERTRQVIDLPAVVPVEVVDHEYYRAWCGVCQRWERVQPDLQEQVLGKARLGIRLSIELAYHRTVMRVPIALIRAYLLVRYRLRVSAGGIVRILEQVAKRLAGLLDLLKEEARASAVKHMDETFWREAGQNGYVWCLTTPEGVRLFSYARSRAAAVADALLGPHPTGTLVTDFYSAYNNDEYAHQRCWAHLFDALRDLEKHFPDDPSVAKWADDLGALYTKAVEQKGAGRAAYDAIVAESNALANRHAGDEAHPCHVLAGRLLRFQDQLYRFVLDPSIPTTNNLAERSIRPLTVQRKISGGTRSPAGSETRMALASAFGTWQARGLDLMAECRSTLVAANAPPGHT